MIKNKIFYHAKGKIKLFSCPLSWKIFTKFLSNEERKNTVEVCQVLKLKTDLLVFVNALKFWVFVTASSINYLQNMQCLSNENNLISEFLNLQCVMISYQTLFFSAYFSNSFLAHNYHWFFFSPWLYPLSKDPSGYTRLLHV